MAIRQAPDLSAERTEVSWRRILSGRAGLARASGLSRSPPTDERFLFSTFRAASAAALGNAAPVTDVTARVVRIDPGEDLVLAAAMTDTKRSQ